MRILTQTCNMVQHSSNMGPDAMGSEDKYDCTPSIMAQEGDSSRDEFNNTSYIAGRSGSSPGNDFIAPFGSTFRCESSEPLLPTQHLSLPMSRALSLPLYVNSLYDTSYKQRLRSASSCGASMRRSTSVSTSPSSQECGFTRRRKRSYTKVEKIRIAKVRKVGACTKCSKAHRKCGHVIPTSLGIPEYQRQGTERDGLYEDSPPLVTQDQRSSSAFSSEAHRKLSEPPFRDIVWTSSRGGLVEVNETPEPTSDDGQPAELYHDRPDAELLSSSYGSDPHNSKRRSHARHYKDNTDATLLYPTPNPFHLYPGTMIVPFVRNTVLDTVQNEQSQVQPLSSAYVPHDVGYSRGHSENLNRQAPVHHEHYVTDFGSPAQSLTPSPAENSKHLTVRRNSAVTLSLDEICQLNQMEQDMLRTPNCGSHSQVSPVWMTASNLTASTAVSEASHSNEQSIGMFTGYSVFYKDHVSPGCTEENASPRFQGHHWPNYEETPDDSLT